MSLTLAATPSSRTTSITSTAATTVSTPNRATSITGSVSTTTMSSGGSSVPCLITCSAVPRLSRLLFSPHYLSLTHTSLPFLSRPLHTTSFSHTHLPSTSLPPSLSCSPSYSRRLSLSPYLSPTLLSLPPPSPLSLHLPTPCLPPLQQFVHCHTSFPLASLLSPSGAKRGAPVQHNADHIAAHQYAHAPTYDARE